MPKKAHDLTTEQAVKRMFPKKARETVRAEAQKARKPKPKAIRKQP